MEILPRWGRQHPHAPDPPKIERSQLTVKSWGHRLHSVSSRETYLSASVSYTRLMLGGSCGLLWKSLLSATGRSLDSPACIVLSCGIQHQDPEHGHPSEVTPSELSPKPHEIPHTQWYNHEQGGRV